MERQESLEEKTLLYELHTEEFMQLFDAPYPGDASRKGLNSEFQGYFAHYPGEDITRIREGFLSKGYRLAEVQHEGYIQMINGNKEIYIKISLLEAATKDIIMGNGSGASYNGKRIIGL